MNIVEPIREKEKVEEVYKTLKAQNERDAMLFLTGVYTGLRISDYRMFRVRDCLRPYYSVREKKTGKQKIYEWNPYLKRELDKYIQEKEPDEFLFKSRKGLNQPITRERAYVIIKQGCNKCGIYNVGTHTLRKTFGLFLYEQSENNIGMLMDIFNHSSERITLRYIGITQEKNNKVMKKMRYF